MRKICVLVSCLLLTVAAPGQQTKPLTCTGKVIDTQGQPVVGARVRLYEVLYNATTYSYDIRLMEEATTKTDGAFSFSIIADSSAYLGGYIVAQKEGLAMDYDSWDMEKDKALEIKLGQAKELAGIVVDQSDKPVSGAQLSISSLLIDEGEKLRELIGLVTLKVLTTSTDSAGRFKFTGIPAEATAEFIVKKKGRATVSTHRRVRYGEKLNFLAGQTDIKLVSPVEAKIEGMVVKKNTGKPIGGVEVIVNNDRYIGYFNPIPVVSREDGTFCIDSLTSDRYRLGLVHSRDELADWAAEPIEVITEAGKTKSEVRIEVSKGGILEVVVTDAVNKKPVEKASVSIRNQASREYHSGRSDKNGIARIRLVPGEYQISYIYKQGYSRQRPQDAITIEDGKTEHIEHELARQPKIVGVLRDEKDKPVEGVEMKVCPTGGQDATSDTEGRFELRWDPRSYGVRDAIFYLVARQEQRNLAAAVAIDEDTQTLDIKLKPGVTFTGKVVDPDGKGVADALITIYLRGGGSPIGHDQAQTDAQGKFEIKAIPMEHTYSIYTRAKGYGENFSQEISTNDAVNNQLDIGNIPLAVANLSVSGRIVDAQGNPMAHARIYGSGPGQPRSRTQADTEGNFTLEGVCAGRVDIRTNVERDGKLLSARVSTDGGATDVRVVISERPSTTRYLPKQPPSLVGRPLPELKDLKIDLSPTDADDKMIIVCFWDMQQRPSRHCIIQLAKQAEQLRHKGVTVVAVQASKVDENTLNQWVKKYKIPFPVGMIQGDEEETRFNWGVRSLPWLILTDRQHIVRAEGFAISELDQTVRLNTHTEEKSP